MPHFSSWIFTASIVGDGNDFKIPEEQEILIFYRALLCSASPYVTSNTREASSPSESVDRNFFPPIPSNMNGLWT